MNNEFAQIGKDLVETSKRSSSARGMVDELFPYLYVASKRMSIRAISRWLEEEKNINLSHVSISKALKNTDGHFRAILDNVWPAAQQVGRECNLTASEVLFEEDGQLEAYLLEHENPHPKTTEKLDVASWSDMQAAVKKLRTQWFAYPAEVRAECCRFVDSVKEMEG